MRDIGGCVRDISGEFEADEGCMYVHVCMYSPEYVLTYILTSLSILCIKKGKEGCARRV